MKIFIFFLFISLTFAGDYYSSSSLDLDTFEPEPMHDFLNSPNDTAEDIPDHWYRIGENGKEIKGTKNYQDNIIRIVLSEINDQFSDFQGARAEFLQKIADYLNNFIDNRYIPKDYREIFKKIYKCNADLIKLPVFNAPAFLYATLSDDAKKAFQNGRRIKLSYLNPKPETTDDQTIYQADPIMVEVLVLQMFIEAQRTSKRRQELLYAVNKKIERIQQIITDNDSAIVGNLDTIKQNLYEFANNESPLAALFSYALGLLKDKKLKKTLEDSLKDILDESVKYDLPKKDIDSLKSNGKNFESLWQKTNKSDNQKKDSDGKKPKNLWGEIKQDVEDTAKKSLGSGVKGETGDVLGGILGSLSQKLKGIVPNFSGAGNNLLGNLVAQ